MLEIQEVKILTLEESQYIFTSDDDLQEWVLQVKQDYLNKMGDSEGTLDKVQFEVEWDNLASTNLITSIHNKGSF